MKGLAYAAAVAMVGSLAGFSTPARAAEITRTVSGFEDGDSFPLGLDLQVSYERLQERALINRENHQNGDIADVEELRLTDVQQQLPIRLAVGIWHDLELHAELPIVLSWVRTYGYPSVTSGANSTVANNCVTARGGYDCSSAGGFYNPNNQVHRSGVGNLKVGTAFAVLSEKRDDTKPTWVIGFDYTYPLAKAINPSIETSATDPGAVGDKVEEFEPYMAMSKRVGYVDPYVKFSASLPHLLGGYYSNCDTPSTLAFPENCPGGSDANSTWTREDTGEKAPYTGTLIFGAEFYVFDAPQKNQSLIIDLRGTGEFVSEGRYYNEMSDQLGKLLYTEQYLHMGGTFGLTARASQYVALHLAASYFHDTDHFLTNENVGVDTNGDGKVDLPASPTTPDTAGELSPNYDFRWDSVGRRFRIGQVNDFYFQATGVLTF